VQPIFDLKEDEMKREVQRLMNECSEAAMNVRFSMQSDVTNEVLALAEKVTADQVDVSEQLVREKRLTAFNESLLKALAAVPKGIDEHFTTWPHHSDGGHSEGEVLPEDRPETGLNTPGPVATNNFVQRKFAYIARDLVEVFARFGYTMKGQIDLPQVLKPKVAAYGKVLSNLRDAQKRYNEYTLGKRREAIREEWQSIRNRKQF
jgi:hypothetical protein